MLGWCKRNGGEALAGIILLGSVASCTLLTRDNAQKALRVADIACIIASAFTDSESVMNACQIERELRPIVEQLLAQKRAAQRASACGPQGDAGAP
jgi:hypothetical protein